MVQQAARKNSIQVAEISSIVDRSSVCKGPGLRLRYRGTLIGNGEPRLLIEPRLATAGGEMSVI